ncbi:MAG: VanZ family protein [Candidatus Bipolaricaulis sp.]|nr:VanZ family protein [Candidatus Bipolaricaulis sp.]
MPRSDRGDRARPATVRRAISRVALGLGLVAIGWMSLRPVGDSTLDRFVRASGNGYLHLPAYAILAILFIFVLGRSPRRVLLSGSLATAYGWALEVAQLATATRHFNLRGLAFDAAGAAFACLVVLALGGLIRGSGSGSTRR